MSIRTVAAKDIKRTTRSRALWAMATTLAVLFALIAYGFDGYQLTPTESVQELFRTLSIVLAVLLPIVALVSSYLAIAGERESGGIKFLLSVPNTRRDVFVGKLLSRFLVVSAGVAFIFAAAVSVAVAKHGVLAMQSTVGLFVLSVVYATIFVGIAVALSAAAAARSRAVSSAIGAYFLLVILYVVPFFRISTIVQWLHTTVLGFSPNLDLYNAITYTSPFIAFRKATNLVFPASQEVPVFRRGADAVDLPVYLSDEFSLVIFAVWLIFVPVAGYLRFNRADLE